MPCKGSTVQGCKPSLGVKRLSSKQMVSTMRAAPDMQVKHGSYMRVPWSEEISLKVESTQTVKRNRFISGLMSPPSSSDRPNSETFQNFRLQSGVLVVWGTKVWWRWWMSTSHSDMVLDPLPHYYTSIFSTRVTLEEHPWLLALSYSPASQTDAHSWRSKGDIFHPNSRQALKRKKKKMAFLHLYAPLYLFQSRNWSES